MLATPVSLASLVAALTLGAADATPATDAPRLTPVVFPPAAPNAEGEALALGLAERAAAELYATGRYNHLHLKQVLSLMRQRGVTSAALGDEAAITATAPLLGAELGAFGELRSTDGQWTLTMSVFDLRHRRLEGLTTPLGQDFALAVETGGRAIAAALAAFDGVALSSARETIHPHTTSDEAMRAFLDCFAVLVRQSLGLRKAHTIAPQTLADARARCEAATAADPGFAAGWAALSFARALSFDHQAAEQALRQARAASGYLPLTVLAHYWLATRFSGNDAGTEVLRRAVETSPGALIFLTYLGEHLNIVARYDEALATWQRYLAIVAESPYAMAQAGYSLARLGRLDEAIAQSRQASRLDPTDLEIKLELASRLVDAGRLTEAEAALLPMVRHPGVYGEVVLRLGYVYLLQRRDDLAEEQLRRALELAKGPHEWRTRGRTHYDLAIVEARRGTLAAAEDHLLAAAADGFVDAKLLAADPDLKLLAGRPKVAKLLRGRELTAPSLLRLTPFPTDALGTTLPDAKRPTAPGFNF